MFFSKRGNWILLLAAVGLIFLYFKFDRLQPVAARTEEARPQSGRLSHIIEANRLSLRQSTTNRSRSVVSRAEGNDPPVSFGEISSITQPSQATIPKGFR